jgi:hypothetical protein
MSGNCGRSNHEPVSIVRTDPSLWLNENRECNWRHALRLTSLLSDALPRLFELEPGRNRRVHWSSLVSLEGTRLVVSTESFKHPTEEFVFRNASIVRAVKWRRPC